MPTPDLDALNQREFRKLVLSIKASTQRLDLLLAICDDRNLQARLIADYEQALKAADIVPLRVRLNPKQPSLRAALETLVAGTSTLQAGKPAVVTVLNAGSLLGVRLHEEKSEQERFFFSLQWTREALRHFQFPIVLWLPDAIATGLAQQAPDFWSWRSGVFEFVAQPAPAAAPTAWPLPAAQETTATASPGEIADLRQQIADLEATAPGSPLLITLYNTLGEAFEGQYAYAPALDLYEKALKLAETKADRAGQARSRRNLGDALRACGRPFQVLDFYQQALALYRELEDRNGESTALNQLGNAYASLGQYQQAIALYQQWLEIAREIGDRAGEGRALGGLGNAYVSLGQYQEAIALYQQWLEIAREIGDRAGEGSALGGLGLAYSNLGQYQEAIALYQQCLEIAREIGDRRGEAISLFNQGVALARIDEKWEAQACYEAAKAIYEELGLPQEVEKCDDAIRDLGQRIVVEPKSAPVIGHPKPAVPDWVAKSMPTAESPPSQAEQRPRMPLWVWFLVGLGFVVLVGWLMS